MITPDTTIDELLKAGLIRVRTYNCLRSVNYRTMGRILQSIRTEEDLLNIWGLGRKSLSELTPLLSQLRQGMEAKGISPEQLAIAGWQDILARAYQTATDGPGAVATHLRATYPTPQSLHAAIVGDGAALLVKFRGEAKENNRERTVEMRKRYRQFIQQVLAADLGGSAVADNLRERYTAKQDMLTDHMNDYSPLDTLEDLSPERLAYAEDLFRAACDKHLSRFPQFRRRYMGSLADALAYHRAHRSQNLQSVQGALDVQRIMQREVMRIAALENQTFQHVRVTHFHPFLKEEQCRFVCEYVGKYGHEPRFFLLYHFMRTAKARGERAHRMYNQRFGLGCERRSLDDIAKSYGLTRERVRQITVSTKSLPVCDTPYITADDWVRYDCLWKEPFIGEHTPSLIDILQREQLEGAHFNALAQLLIHLPNSKHDLVNVKGHTLLVSQGMMGQEGVGRLADALQQCIDGHYPADSRVAVNYVAASAPYRSQPAAAALVTYLAQHVYDIPIEDGHLVLRQNYVDVEAELMAILTEAGEPMSAEKLLEAFKQRNPQHRYANATADKIVPFLIRNNRIRSIGRTGRYALDSWNINTDTIRSLLMKRLQEADTPLHISKLHEAVSEHYPNVSVRSLASNMSHEAFVHMGKGFYGLAAKSYNGWTLPPKAGSKRTPTQKEGWLPFD